MGQLDFESQWKKRFEQFAHANTEAAIAGWSESGLEARVHFFKNYCDIAPKKNFSAKQSQSQEKVSDQPNTDKQYWLDIGCGAGTYCKILNQQDIDVIGLDYSLPSLKKAKESLNTIPWVAADVYQLPIKPQSAAGVLCFGVLQALENDKALCQQLSKVLQPGSELWLDGLNRWCLWHLWDTVKRKLLGKAKHLHFSNPWRIKRLLKLQGFESVTLYWAPILPKPLTKLQRLVLHPSLQKLYQSMPWSVFLVTHAFYVHAKKGAGRAATLRQGDNA